MWQNWSLSLDFLRFGPSDVAREQKSGSSRVQGLLFGFRSGSRINISGMFPSGFRGLRVFKVKFRIG